ncbi:hypothetical protein [Microbulbifer litoralis]|uniref:hypothetical protein n=1 Tax=Microbulbifer litoralis TaxID=2933965 RepID=UPI002028B180|nr:hypothetical protein [Microbulbifer sp. GX H0434]
MKKIILHIGPHKTGSTSLQSALRSNRAELEDVGVLYPVTGTGKSDARIHGQHNLAWDVGGDYRFKSDLGSWDELRDEIHNSNCEYVFISSEAFSLLSKGPVKRVIEALQEYDLRIVYVARFYTDVIRSVYAMLAIKWNTRSASSFYRAKVSSGIDSINRSESAKRLTESEPAIATFLHRPKVEQWIKMLGADAVSILFYDDLFPGYFEKLASVAGLPRSLPIIDMPRLNSARSLAHIGIVASICRALDGIMERAEFNIELAPYVAKSFEEFSSSLPQPEGLPDDVLSKLASYVEADMEWLEQYARVPASWKSFDEGGKFVEPDIPSLEVGRLLAGDFISRRIRILADIVERMPGKGKSRSKIEERKKRLEEIRDRLKM